MRGASSLVRTSGASNERANPGIPIATPESDNGLSRDDAWAPEGPVRENLRNGCPERRPRARGVGPAAPSDQKIEVLMSNWTVHFHLPLIASSLKKTGPVSRLMSFVKNQYAPAPPPPIAFLPEA